MLKKTGHFAVDTIFPTVASSTDRSIGFEADCDLTRLEVQYTDILNRVLVDQRSV